jgi:FtsZ-binding cell division protein ZapB
MTTVENLRKKKYEMMREAAELMDVRDILERKVKRLKSKKYSNPEVLRILERDLAAIKRRKGGYNERLLHLGYLINQEKRGKR